MKTSMFRTHRRPRRYLSAVSYAVILALMTGAILMLAGCVVMPWTNVGSPPGRTMWTASAATGVLVCGAEGPQMFPQVVADPANQSATVIEPLALRMRPYARRFTSVGRAGWFAPVLLSNTASEPGVIQAFAEIALTTDNAGGAIVTWTHLRTQFDPPQLTSKVYAQCIKATGAKLWGPRGTEIMPRSGGTEWQMQPKIASDGVKGAIVVWEHSEPGTSGYIVRGQRVYDSAP